MSQIMTNLEESPQFFEQSIDLIERSFQYEQKYSYKDDFSILYSKKNRKNCFLLIEHEQVIATACSLPRILSNQIFETPVCFIGGLSSHESIRGKGIFKKFFQNIIKILENDFSLFMLWSQLSEFYEKFNFYEAGCLYEYSSLKENQLKKLVKADFLSIEDKEHIKKLFLKSYSDCFVPKRDVEDWKILFSHKSIDIYLEKINGEVINYCLANKGMDLKRIIHESSKILSNKDSEFKVWSPHYSASAIKKYLSFIKINNNHFLKDFIAEISNNQMEIINIEDDNVFFRFNNNSFHIAISDFITGIFGPSQFKEFSDFNSKIWIPGFESV